MCTIQNNEYKNMIHSLVVPENLPDEERCKKYQPLIDFIRINTPDKLFRFRSCKERAFKEFDQDILGFSPAFEMNDDFDGMLYFDKERIKKMLIDNLAPQNINSFLESACQGKIPSEIKSNIPEDFFQQMIDTLSCYKSDTISELTNSFIDFVTEDYDKRMVFLNEITRNQKIACLSTNIESAAMWGYYANDGKGFALSYDLREPSFSEYCLVPVVYDEERFDATEYAMWLFQQQTVQRIFLNANAYNLYSFLQNAIPCPDQFMPTKILIHKSISWSHEKEWRLIFYEKNIQSKKYPSISKKPTAIYLGRNISAINEKILRQIAMEKNIPAYKMMIRQDNQTYSLYPQIL